MKRHVYLLTVVSLRKRYENLNERVDLVQINHAFQKGTYRIDGVMVSVIASSSIGCGFDPQSDQARLCNWYVLLNR
jgi:hypothetical protein